MRVAKTIVQILAAVLAAIAPALLSDGMGLIEWINVGVLGIGAYQVWNTANTNFWPAGKAFASAAMSVLVLLTSLVSNIDFGGIDLANGLSPGTIAQIVIAVLAPVGVYMKSNNVTNRPIDV